MTDYNELFKSLQDSLKHFNFGKNGEGWLGGINWDKDGFKDIDLKDFAKKISDILGYDIDFDSKDADNQDHIYPKNNVKNTDTMAKVCNCENECTCKKCDVNASYNTHVDNGVFTLEVLIPGETVDNFRISANEKTMKLKVARKVVDENLPWYAACKNNVIEVDLPERLVIDSLKKNAKNGLLVVTGKIAEQKDFETEI